MKIKLIITGIIALLAFASLISAQNKPGKAHRLDDLKSFLSLTDDQAIKVKEILAKEEEKALKEENAKPVNRKKALKNAQTRMRETDKEIEALLTPEQLKKYESYKIERKSELKGRRKGTKFYRE